MTSLKLKISYLLAVAIGEKNCDDENDVGGGNPQVDHRPDGEGETCVENKAHLSDFLVLFLPFIPMRKGGGGGCSGGGGGG